MATGPETTNKKDVDPTKMADEVVKTIKTRPEMVDEIAKTIEQFNLPGVDVESLVASEKKNLEAVTRANQVAFQGLQAVAKRQAEILQEMMNEASTAVELAVEGGFTSGNSCKVDRTRQGRV